MVDASALDLGHLDQEVLEAEILEVVVVFVDPQETSLVVGCVLEEEEAVHDVP